MSLIPALRKQRQEDACEFSNSARVGYGERSWLQTDRQTKTFTWTESQYMCRSPRTPRELTFFLPPCMSRRWSSGWLLGSQHLYPRRHLAHPPFSFEWTNIACPSLDCLVMFMSSCNVFLYISNNLCNVLSIPAGLPYNLVTGNMVIFLDLRQSPCETAAWNVRSAGHSCGWCSLKWMPMLD